MIMASFKIALVGVLGNGIAASLAFADHKPNHPGGGVTGTWVFAILAFFALSSSAYADWGFTKWGMTLEQVVQASEGRVTRYPSSQVDGESTFVGLTTLARLNGYSVAGFNFPKVNFSFDGSKRLASVELSTGNNQFSALNRALRSNFGVPVSEKGGMLPTAIWNDRSKGNSIRLLGFGVTTVIQYTPIVQGF